jgi:uncharacterized damage-inducible protein DinB
MEIRDPAVFLDYLKSTHERTRRLLPLIPVADLEWAPTAGRFTFGDIIRHLAGIERWMYAETVGGRPSRYPGHGRDLADGLEAVLKYYDKLHAESRAIFATIPPDAFMGRAVTPGGATITTYKWLRAMFEHEAHHRGQLYLMLGLRGVVTPPIYGLTEEEVVARSKPAGLPSPG